MDSLPHRLAINTHHPEDHRLHLWWSKIAQVGDELSTLQNKILLCHTINWYLFEYTLKRYFYKRCSLVNIYQIMYSCLWHADSSLPIKYSCLWHADLSLPIMYSCLWHKDSSLPIMYSCLWHADLSLPIMYSCLWHADSALPIMYSCLWHADISLPIMYYFLWHADSSLPIMYSCLWYADLSLPIMYSCLWHADSSLPIYVSIDVFLHIGKNYRRVGEITRAIIIRLRIDTATRIREVFYNLNNVYNYRIPRHQVCV